MTLPAIVIAAVLAASTSVHFPVSTNDPEAQVAIDRGLFLYYAYNGGGAARSFDEDEVIPAGEQVEVVEIRGATALVMP